MIRELGTTEQVMFLAVREGKPGEAVTMAMEHCREKPGVIMQLVQALAEAGASEHGAALLSQLVESGNPHSSYLEWARIIILPRIIWAERLGGDGQLLSKVLRLNRSWLWAR